MNKILRSALGYKMCFTKCIWFDRHRIFFKKIMCWRHISTIKGKDHKQKKPTINIRLRKIGCCTTNNIHEIGFIFLTKMDQCKNILLCWRINRWLRAGVSQWLNLGNQKLSFTSQIPLQILENHRYFRGENKPTWNFLKAFCG